MSATATVIAGLAVKFGAPILKEVRLRRGGRFGEIAGTAIDAVADGLGTAPDPEAIAEAAEREPARAEQVIRQVNDDLARDTEAMALVMTSYHQTLNEDRQSSSLLNRIWRPLNGMAFACSMTFLVFVVAMKIWEGDAETLTALQPLYGFLGAIFGTWATVVGVYVWRRSDEKIVGAD